MRKKTFILITVLAILCIFQVGKIIKDRMFPLKYETLIEEYSAMYNIDKYAVMGIICAESGFEHDAHSGVARGLMQITDETARWISGKIGIEYFEDMVEVPELNIRMGCWYISYLAEYYGVWETALAAYNAGGGRVSRWLSDERYSADGKTLSDIPYGETRRYVERVKKLTAVYRKLY